MFKPTTVRERVYSFFLSFFLFLTDEREKSRSIFGERKSASLRERGKSLCMQCVQVYTHGESW